MANQVQEFYDGSKSRQFLPIYSAVNGNVSLDVLSLRKDGIYTGDELPDSLVDALGANIEQLYSSIKPVMVQQNGVDYTFELGYIPKKDATRTVLRSATYQSSLTGNKGNGFETAVDATLNDHSVAYVASMGMGISSALSGPEQSYLKKYGRLLHEDEKGMAQPMPVISALAKALLQSEIDVTDLYSDSAGAVLNVAYGATYGAGNIVSAHQNVRTGYWDIGVPKLAYGMLRTDAQLSAEYSKLSTDALRMGSNVIDFTNEHLGQTYLDQNFQPKKSARMLAAYAIGFGRGPTHGDPLVADNRALVKANPASTLLFTVGSLDPLAANPELPARMKHIVRAISSEGGRKVMAAIVKGASHSIQTHYPQYLRAIADAALKN